MSAQLVSMDAPIHEAFSKKTLFVRSCKNRPVPQFGAEIIAQLTKDNATWESDTARLLPQCVSQQVSKAASNSTKILDIAPCTQKGNKMKKETDSNKNDC